MTLTKIDHDYFNWLVSQIDIHNKNPNTYNDLFTRMHDTEFVWHVPNDDNRVEDGRYLRTEFLEGIRYGFPRAVSVLEVLVALSRRIAFLAGGDPELWAWQLIENLHLHKASDPLVGQKAERVEDILEALVWRTYEQDGRGGFFPLNEPMEDQTKVEIWFQMQAYAGEIQGP
jgi:hypothetical protein